MSDFVSIIEMVGTGIIEVDGDFHQSQPKQARVEVHISLGIAGDRSHMVQAS
jgi:hypothetical protein